MIVIWSIAAVVFIGGCLTLKYATRPVLWAYEIGRIVGRRYAARQARRERHRNCFAESDVTQLIRTLADAVSVLEARGIVPVDPRPRPDLWLVPYFGQPGSAAPSWNLSPPDGAPCWPLRLAGRFQRYSLSAASISSRLSP